MNRSIVRGFTLVETIAVIVLVAIATVAIASLQSSLFANHGSVTAIQIESRLQMECAEQVLGVMRSAGYDEVTIGSAQSDRFGPNKCDTLNTFSPYSLPTVSATNPYTGSGCPSGYTCKLVSIRQSSLQPVTLLLVNF